MSPNLFYCGKGEHFPCGFSSLLCVLRVLAAPLAGCAGPVFVQRLCLHGVALVGMVIVSPRRDLITWRSFPTFVIQFLYVTVSL